jgi:hypothetical protein
MYDVVGTWGRGIADDKKNVDIVAFNKQLLLPYNNAGERSPPLLSLTVRADEMGRDPLLGQVSLAVTSFVVEQGVACSRWLTLEGGKGSHTIFTLFFA